MYWSAVQGTATIPLNKYLLALGYMVVRCRVCSLLDAEKIIYLSTADYIHWSFSKYYFRSSSTYLIMDWNGIAKYSLWEANACILKQTVYTPAVRRGHLKERGKFMTVGSVYLWLTDLLQGDGQLCDIIWHQAEWSGSWLFWKMNSLEVKFMALKCLFNSITPSFVLKGLIPLVLQIYTDCILHKRLSLSWIFKF